MITAPQGQPKFTLKVASTELTSTLRPDSPDLLALDDARPLYFLPKDNLPEEVLIPGFKAASSADCMVGFFSSGVLGDLAPGLASYISRTSVPFRLIISPYLTESDQAALAAGLGDPSDIAASVLQAGLVSSDALQRHTLTCLSYLVATNRLQIKIALMRNALFHPKVWLFETTLGRLAAHGSSNLTPSGIRRNKEQITISKSWSDPNQRYMTEKLAEEFDRLWQNLDSDCVVVSLPEALRQQLLRNYGTDRPPTEDDFRALYQRAAAATAQDNVADSELALVAPDFSVPTWLKYDSGPFAHQGKAVTAWVNAGFKGTLEMATGSGKTITAMLAAHSLYQREQPLLLIVAAPYRPLIEQWSREMVPFGLRPINLVTAGSAAARGRVLQRAQRRLRLGLSKIEAVVVSHDTLCTTEFHDAIRSFECRSLLVADEAHHLGSERFVSEPPVFIDYRMALSATPIRQYDAAGTEAIFEFFGPVVFRFTLAEAIGVCLVEYDYYVHPVHLTPAEMDAWRDLTAQIRHNAWREADGASDDFLDSLRRARRLILETAENKIQELERQLSREQRPFRHTLIYASDKAPEQLQAVNNLLGSMGVLFRQLTAVESADPELTNQIILSFQRGDTQVLTAKRVLDEGVNIPQVTKAYILASTTVERQWIQRRGRLLRLCPEIHKTSSSIHDFLALPPPHETPDQDVRTLLKSELTRAQEFASLARNAGRPGGPLAMIHSLALTL